MTMPTTPCNRSSSGEPISTMFLFIFLLCLCQTPKSLADRKPYIVYLGAHQQQRGHKIDHICITDHHNDFLGAVLGSKDKAKDAIFYSYTRFINGFAANLEESEVQILKVHPDVVSVFPNRPRKLVTTDSWSFLGLEKGGKIPGDSLWSKAKLGKDVIIANIDTGIWPESKSFNDNGMGPVPAKWKGRCDTQDGVRCNKKLIGARFFNEAYAAAMNTKKQWANYTSSYEKGLKETFLSARDHNGHGTHTLSTAAGVAVPGATAALGLNIVDGSNNGSSSSAKGGAPAARAASYKVCGRDFPDGSGGCYGADILKAFAAAIYDGVEVISVSLGKVEVESFEYYAHDAAVIGAFHAVMHGIPVVSAVGNSGPNRATAANIAPWMLTVGATSFHRDFPSYAELGDDTRLMGQSLSSTKLSPNQKYPLIHSRDAVASGSNVDNAAICLPGSLDPAKAKGKILVCQTMEMDSVKQAQAASQAGAVGLIVVNADPLENVFAGLHNLPATHLPYHESRTLLNYLKSNKNPVASITPPVTRINPEAQPVVASFSSRGPNNRTAEILKPDVVAPGLNIIAAYSEAAEDNHAAYTVLSGTSMACPHVAGVVGLLKSLHPDWSPAAIKSAIMTSAKEVTHASLSYDGSGDISDIQKVPATPFDTGSGLVDPNAAADPGLVYDAKPEDYVGFLCKLGYNAGLMANLTDSETGQAYTCPANPPNILDLNYPSITVPNLAVAAPTTVTRRVKNVGAGAASYTATVVAPDGVSVTVQPNKLQFEKVGMEKTFTVTFKAEGAGPAAAGDASRLDDMDDYSYGSLTWSDGVHSVRSPLVVRVNAKTS